MACFVKVYGAVFLGNPRTPAAAHAHEAPLSMRGPAMVLAAGCVLIGLAPMVVAPLLDAGIAAWMPEMRLSAMPLRTLVPLGAVSVMASALVVLIVVISALLARRQPALRHVGTWDCGYARPTSRMQYTASSFAQMIVGMFGWVLRPQHPTATR